MRSFCPRAGSLLAAAIVAAPLSAQWRQVPTNVAPSRLSGFSLAPLPTGGLLLFGGDAGNPAATEWTWSGTHWQPLATPVPRRSHQAMAANARTGAVHVFGGLDAASQPLFDTWRYDGTWQQVTTATTPSRMDYMSMAYDSAADVMVLIGVSATTGLFETWTLGTDWALSPATLQTGGPGAFSLCSDSVRGHAVLFRVRAGLLEVFDYLGADWRPRASTWSR